MLDDKRSQRIEDKVDAIKDTIGEINTTLAEQHLSLKEHMRRTALLEEKLEPIEKHVNMVSGVFKFLMMAGGAVTFALTLTELVDRFKK